MMKQAYSAFLFLALCTGFSCSRQAEQADAGKERDEITFRESAATNRVDVLVDGELFTSYRWPENVYKPVLYPIVSAGGGVVTRGFPLEPREGERTDHLHQVGNWLNYGNVNGYDFWGNGHTGERSPEGGAIAHVAVREITPGHGEGSLLTEASWRDPKGTELMKEKTTFRFLSRDSVRMIDRITTLIATGGPIRFQDTKEGVFAVRVARELELPSGEMTVLTDASGKPSTGKTAMDSTRSTGNYRSSEGVTGLGVWSTRARWMDLDGKIGGENVSLVICDHPENVSYPTWWHARGYGLFSANPFGAKDFTKGQQELNHSLSEGDSLTLRYRLIVASGRHLSDDEINRYADAFAKKY